MTGSSHRERGRTVAWSWLAWCIGASLSLWQFGSRRTLWLDELALTRSILDRTVTDLVARPLDFDQVAPAGFLLVQKGIVAAFGASEFALRAFPLAMALSALALVVGLGRTVLRGWAASLPVFLLGCSPPMIWLASQAKQYSTDIAATAGLLLVALTVPRWRERPRVRLAVLLAGILAPWFSQPSVFALASAAVGLGFEDWRRERRERWPRPFTVLTVGAWVVSASAALLIARARVTPETMQFMRVYWEAGFAPIPPTRWQDLKWPLYVLRRLVENFVDGWASYVYLGVAALGVWEVSRRSRATAFVLLLPVASAFGAAALRQYPLEGRLAFFLSPVVAVLMGAGVAGLAGLVRRREGLRWIVRPAVLVLIALPMIGVLRHPPPYAIHHLTPLLATLRDQLQPGDRVYVPYGGWQAWTHYAPHTGIGADVILGRCHDRDFAAYGSEVQQLQGATRGWILFVPAGQLEDASVILRRADQLGAERARWVREDRDDRGEPRTIALYLYELHPAADASAPRQAPPAPPTAAECRGAAVDRRVSRARGKGAGEAAGL